MKYNEITKHIHQFPNERWEAIEEHPAYEISDLGRLKHTFKNGKVLIVAPAKNGNKCPNYLWYKIRGKKKYAHQLVLKYFVGERPEGHDCDHIDKDTTNNTLSNLRYITIAENRTQRGIDSVLAKLTEQEVRMIRLIFKSSDTTCTALGEAFKVSATHIRNIITYRRWAHL